MSKVTREYLPGLKLAQQFIAESISEEAASDLDSLIAQASAAPEQAAACYQFQDREGKWHGFADERHQAATIESGDWPIRKLYTHADDGEVERLRAELADSLAARDKWGSNFQKAISAGAAIEQQLAEAQALLRESDNWVRVLRTQFGYSQTLPLAEQIDAFLSATAQPAECQTCSGHGLIGNGVDHGELCPDCNQPAEVKS